MKNIILFLILTTFLSCKNGVEEEQYQKELQSLVERLDLEIEKVEKEIEKIEKKYQEKADEKSPQAHPVIVKELQKLETIKNSLTSEKNIIQNTTERNIKKLKVDIKAMIARARKETTRIRQEFKYISKPQEENTKERKVEKEEEG